MNCKRLEEDLLLYAFGELDAKKAPVIEQHVATCEPCRKELSAYQVAADGMQRLPTAPEPSLSTERLRQAILSHELRSRPNWAMRFAVVGAAAAAFIAALVSINHSPIPSGNANKESGLIANASGPDKSNKSDRSYEPYTSYSSDPSDQSDISDRIDYWSSGPQIANTTKRTTKKTRGNKNGHVILASNTKKSQSEKPNVLAITSGGVESAANVFADAGTTALMESAPAKRDVIVIQPGRGGASEVRSPDVISIGG